MTIPIRPYQRQFSESSKRILVLGTRAPFSLELCRHFRHAGHRVYAAESIKPHLARGSTYVTKSFLIPPPAYEIAAFTRELNRIVADERIDIVIPTSEETFHVARVRSQLSDRCAWFVPPLEVLKRLHNKYKFIQWVQELGFPVPKTDLIVERSQLDSVAQRIDSGEELVLKPVYSRFSAKTLIRPQSAEQVFSAIGDASLPAPWVCQEYMPGRQISSYSVSQNGRVKAHSDYASTFRINIGTGIHFESIRHAATYEFVSNFVKETGYTGQIAFDFIEAEDGSVRPIECNPRATSGVHLFKRGAGLTASFFGDQSETLFPSAGDRAQFVTAMLAFGWMSKTQSKASWLRNLLTSRDAVFSWRDPVPLFWLIVGFVRNEVLASRQGITGAEAATADFEWNGEP